jgi:hypothetical protein
VSQGGRLRCQTYRQPRHDQEDSHVSSRSPALLGHLLAVGGAHEAFLPSGALREPDLATSLGNVVAALVDAQPEREPELAGVAAAQEVS